MAEHRSHPGWLLQPDQILLGAWQVEAMAGPPGGMGQVFRARDLRLGIPVAIKVPALTILMASKGPERFLAEARKAAQLGAHPNIVQIRACLTDPGFRLPTTGAEEVEVPFIVMEYLRGGDLAHRLARGLLPLSEAAGIFAAMCAAVAHAHTHVYSEEGHARRGLVHRDLKPQNVCFDERSRVVVVDFGLARLLDDPSSSGGLSGTPTHMAPEQWDPTRGPIDERTDIYALGVVLYEMVCGGLPFPGLSPEQLIAAHLSQPPPDPRNLRRDLPEAVAAAVQQAMAKAQADRFASVEALAAAVAEGFAAPAVPSWPVAIELPAGGPAVPWPPIPSDVSAAGVDDAGRTLQGHTGAVFSLAVTPDGRQALSASADATLRVWDLGNDACLRTLEGHTRGIYSVAVTPDSHRALSASEDATLRMWDLDSGACLGILEGHTLGVRSVAVTPDSRGALSGSQDATLRVWDLGSGTCVRTLQGHIGAVFSVAVTPDGRGALSAGEDATLRVWDLGDGACLRTLEGHTGPVMSVAVTSDGHHALSASFDGTVRLWNFGSGACLRTFEHNSVPIWAVAVTPDGRRVLSAGQDARLRVWDLGSGACLLVLGGHAAGAMMSVAVTPDGGRALSGRYDSIVWVWNLGDALGEGEAQPDGGATETGRGQGPAEATCCDNPQAVAIQGRSYCGNCGSVWAFASPGSAASRGLNAPASVPSSAQAADQRICPACGTSTVPDVVRGVPYCSNCGRSLSS